MKNQEIEDLMNAWEASPDNSYILMMLVRKMNLHPTYDDQLGRVIHAGLTSGEIDQELELKEILASLYYRQGKFSACLVLADEIGDKAGVSDKTKAMFARCYLEEGNRNTAQAIYQDIVNRDPSFSDEKLDEAFRMKTAYVDDAELDGLFNRPDISFVDVGGMKDVKREIDLKIIKPLENAELYASYGKKVGGGILLYGPPGCGKTYIARATAGEINANFINITLNDILDMWIGNSEKNLNRYFEMARENTPCVMFFDEIDALGAKRSDMKQSGGKNVINQFLSELDGVESDNEGILIIGATNMPWHLDAAFRRPGRFDRIIFVPPPDEESKEAILKLKLKDKPQEKVDFAKIAKKAKDYSGADLNAIIDIAVENILEEAIETGLPKPITTRDLLAAMKKHHASTLEWFTTAKNYAMFANKSGIYDDILKFLK